MKRYYKVLLPALALFVALSGCKGGEPERPSETVPVTIVTEVGTTQVDVATDESVSEVLGTTHGMQTTAKTDKESTVTTAEKTTKAALGSDLTAPNAAGTTQKKPTGAGEPTKTTKGTTTTTTKAATTTAKPSATTDGKPAPITTTTTKPGETTTAPGVKGELLKGRITYLNEGDSAYLDNITPAKLKLFGIKGAFDKTDYAVYTLDMILENKESVPVTIYHLDVGNNGSGGVYLNGDTSGDIGLPVGGKITNRFYVLAPAEDRDSEVLNKIRKMDLKLRYAATPEDDSITPTYVFAKIN